MGSRRLLFVHAHPDDESLGTGGTIARYSDEGAHVCLVTCTNGELGEIADVPELGTHDEIAAHLGEIRRDELVAACRHLGEVDIRFLGYHDSGMAGTPSNDAPRAFVNQPLDEAARKVANIIDELRPQILITYNEFGFYGHPDHIRAHEVAMRALELADHAVAKVYHTAVARSVLEAGREAASQMGMDADDYFSEDDITAIATDDDRVTTWIDVAEYVDVKFAALAAHRTQLGTTQGFLDIPREYRVRAFGVEHYVLARSTAPPPEGREDDLFQGLAV